MDGKILTFEQIKRYVKSAVAAAVLKGDFFTPEMHRMIFRGKNLGNSLTTKQLNAINNGSFEDLWLGDYWVIGGVNWRIADFDYFYNRGIGVNNISKHHLVIVPDTAIGGLQQIDTDSTVEYNSSNLFETGLGGVKEICEGVFGNNIIPFSVWVSTSYTDGIPTDGRWSTETVSLLSDFMLFGQSFRPLHRNDTVQLSLFSVKPLFIGCSKIVWTRSKVNDDYFFQVDAAGSTNFKSPTTYAYVRPFFIIGKVS